MFVPAVFKPIHVDFHLLKILPLTRPNPSYFCWMTQSVASIVRISNSFRATLFYSCKKFYDISLFKALNFFSRFKQKMISYYLSIFIFDVFKQDCFFKKLAWFFCFFYEYSNEFFANISIFITNSPPVLLITSHFCYFYFQCRFFFYQLANSVLQIPDFF